MQHPETFHLTAGNLLDAAPSSEIGQHFAKDFDHGDATNLSEISDQRRLHAEQLAGWYWRHEQFPGIYGPHESEDAAKGAGNEAVQSGHVQVGSVDLTPTWSGVMPLLIEAALAGSATANSELRRLASLADKLQPALTRIGKLVRGGQADIDAGRHALARSKFEQISLLIAEAAKSDSNETPLPVPAKDKKRART